MPRNLGVPVPCRGRAGPGCRVAGSGSRIHPRADATGGDDRRRRRAGEVARGRPRRPGAERSGDQGPQGAVRQGHGGPAEEGRGAAAADRVAGAVGPVAPGPAPQDARGRRASRSSRSIQQKQIGVLEEQSQLVADQVEKQAPVVEKLQTQTATLESRVEAGGVTRPGAGRLAGQRPRCGRQPAAVLRPPPRPPEGAVPAQRDERDPDHDLQHVSTRYDNFQRTQGGRVLPVRGVSRRSSSTSSTSGFCSRRKSSFNQGGRRARPGPGRHLHQRLADRRHRLLPGADRASERAARPGVDQQAARHPAGRCARSSPTA